LDDEELRAIKRKGKCDKTVARKLNVRGYYVDKDRTAPFSKVEYGRNPVTGLDVDDKYDFKDLNTFQKEEVFD
jgi:hypothetical protein